MSFHQRRWTQTFPISLNEAWQFFSDPRNLSKITPPSMNFRIVRVPEGEMYEGMLIEYRVSPLFGISLPWVTEITKIRDRSFFIDEQRIGPYRLWHHEHHFREVPGGVEMMDLLSYQLPIPGIRAIIAPLLVNPKIEHIFRYRTKILHERFGSLGTTERSP